MFYVRSYLEIWQSRTTLVIKSLRHHCCLRLRNCLFHLFRNFMSRILFNMLPVLENTFYHKFFNIRDSKFQHRNVLYGTSLCWGIIVSVGRRHQNDFFSTSFFLINFVVKIGPSFVTMTVCSIWATKLLSLVSNAQSFCLQ